jgi:hypothetical protein
MGISVRAQGTPTADRRTTITEVSLSTGAVHVQSANAIGTRWKVVQMAYQLRNPELNRHTAGSNDDSGITAVGRRAARISNGSQHARRRCTANQLRLKSSEFLARE